MLKEMILSSGLASSSCTIQSTAANPEMETTTNTLARREIDESSSLIADSSRPQMGDPESLKYSSAGDYGTLGSMSIAVNFLTGPAMLQIPAMFQKSGLIPATLCIVFTCAFTTFGNLHFANAISKLPGNYEFTKEIEYSDAFERYWPDNKRWFRSTEIVFFLCITCLNVSSIVDSAQVLDVMLANVGCLGYKSHAIRCTTSSASVVLGLDCVHETWTLESCASDADCVPFSDHEDEGGILFTLGYALGVLFFMPLALMDLQENAFWQIIEFVVLIITTIMFSGLLLSQGIEWKGRLSLWGTNWNSLLGVVLFNFALPMSIPAWLYEKEQNVNAVKVISGSSITAAGLYIVLGVLGAMSGPNIADNMLETFMSGGKGSAMQVTSFFFAVFIVGLGIPLLSVLGRLNLTGSGYSNFIGNVFAVYIPFGLSWLFYRGGLVTLLFAWGGILFTSLIAFLFPIFLSLRALDVSENPGAIFGQQDRQHQKRLLLCLLAVAIVAVSISIVGNLIPMAKRPNEPPDR